jgi:hypothetical protein
MDAKANGDGQEPSVRHIFGELPIQPVSAIYPYMCGIWLMAAIGAASQQPHDNRTDGGLLCFRVL